VPEIQKCDGRQQFCDMLNERLGDGHSKGLNYNHVVNFRTGADLDPIVSYRTSANDKGLLLNFCPWCGRSLNRVYRKRKASHA
jgi:hypothetical protein